MTNEVFATMFTNNLKVAAALVLAIALVGSGLGGLVYQSQATGQDKKNEVGRGQPAINPANEAQKDQEGRRRSRGQLIATKLALETHVPEKVAGKLRPGQKVTVAVDATPRKVYSGKVQTISKKPGRAEGGVKVVVELLDPDRRLAAGMSAEFIFPTEADRGLCDR